MFLTLYTYATERTTALQIVALVLIGLAAFTSPARADCTGPAGVASQTRYDGVENKLYYCNDTDWVEMGGSGGGGTPTCTLRSSPGSVSCNAGEVMTGGGCHAGGGGGDYNPYPSADDTWSCQGTYPMNSTAYAICCTFSGGGGGGCPAGFTEMTNLGCMQNANEGNGTYATAVTDCYDTYGARLPLLGDRHLAAVHAGFNFTLADNEWVQGGGAGASGECPRITNSGGAGLRPCNWNTDYRCFIPN